MEWYIYIIPLSWAIPYNAVYGNFSQASCRLQTWKSLTITSIRKSMSTTFPDNPFDNHHFIKLTLSRLTLYFTFLSNDQPMKLAEQNPGEKPSLKARKRNKGYLYAPKSPLISRICKFLTWNSEQRWLKRIFIVLSLSRGWFWNLAKIIIREQCILGNIYSTDTPESSDTIPKRIMGK